MLSSQQYSSQHYNDWHMMCKQGMAGAIICCPPPPPALRVPSGGYPYSTCVYTDYIADPAGLYVIVLICSAL